MRKFTALLALFAAILAVALTPTVRAQYVARNPDWQRMQDWRDALAMQLPLLGHRNWILVVDSAYPDQVGPGIETYETGADMLPALKEVLTQIQNSIHLRPVIYLDAELPYVPDNSAPGVSDYRNQLTSMLGDLEVHHRLHQTLIDQVAKDSQQYHILILKTRLAIPYTSVFINLRAKYWSDDNEHDLRQSMSGARIPGERPKP
ncbi:MAG TPA: hypothetical protein VG844_15220 [Terracidiphilus sp.]|nr:hypothetical protein [Terracidiphilus sp.]